MLASGANYVHLDVKSHITREKIMEHFPNIYEKCLSYDVDITTDLVPVVPAAHYFCGGVWVDEWGRTSLKNLYAAGEVSCTGVHGANRLGSASLLEGLVWGWRTAEDALRTIDEPPGVDSTDIPPYVMWNYVGLMRSTRRLERAIDDLRHLRAEIDKFYRTTKLSDELIGLRNSVQVALIVAHAAWENKVSRGCHYRED
jgi:L-aspartate oxidase